MRRAGQIFLVHIRLPHLMSRWLHRTLLKQIDAPFLRLRDENVQAMHTSTVEAFEYSASQTRVASGQASVEHSPRELLKLGAETPFLLSSSRHSERLATLSHILPRSSMRPAGTYNGVIMHTPSNIIEEAVFVLLSKNASSLIFIGGGSTLGLGKALSILTGLPYICFPTTCAGLEMTPISDETSKGKKIIRSDAKILSSVVIYDVDLTMSLLLPFLLPLA